MTTRTSGKRRVTGITVVIVLLVVLLILAGAALSARGFKSQFDTFIVAENAYKDSAMKPATEDNPLRKEIGFLLAQAIQIRTMPPADRIKIANRGIALLNELEVQIDAIKDEGDKVAPLVDALEKSANGVGNVTGRSEKKKIVSLARKNAEIISDIRGLSYRADYYTGEVFERVIDDQGAMTDEHITYLNQLIPQLEEQFNRRQNLYTDLAKNVAEIQELGKSLGYTP